MSVGVWHVAYQGERDGKRKLGKELSEIERANIVYIKVQCSRKLNPKLDRCLIDD